MCIIVVKPKNIPMPSMDTLRICFDNNHDGAGYMYATGKTVEVRKGFMDWLSFQDAIEAEGDMTERAVVMHFRIATHGKVQPGCCHPFPVTDDMERLRETSCHDSLCVAHNGIISGMETSDTVSDTMAYVASVMTPLRRMAPSMLFSEDALSIIDATLGSKMALLDASGELVTVGSFHENEGVLYSNSTYTRSITSFRSYESAWNGYEDFYGVGQQELWGYPYYACEECPGVYACAEDVPRCVTERQANDYVDGYRADIMLTEETPDRERFAAVA